MGYVGHTGRYHKGSPAGYYVLGCTAFGMLVQPDDSSVPVVDTAVLHVEAAVNAALTDD